VTWPRVCRSRNLAGQRRYVIMKVCRGDGQQVEDALRGAADRAAPRRVAPTGDPVFVSVPPKVPEGWLVNRVPGRLAEMLAMHNAACQVMERTRLRMALQAWESVGARGIPRPPSCFLRQRESCISALCG
jgi:hypothetical protein